MSYLTKKTLKFLSIYRSFRSWFQNKSQLLVWLQEAEEAAGTGQNGTLGKSEVRPWYGRLMIIIFSLIDFFSCDTFFSNNWFSVRNTFIRSPHAHTLGHVTFVARSMEMLCNWTIVQVLEARQFYVVLKQDGNTTDGRFFGQQLMHFDFA